MKQNRICVCAITGSYGVRGEARVKSFCAEPSALADYGPLSNEAGDRQFQISITRPVKGGFAVRLTGVKTKEQADALKGTRLYVDRSTLPSLPDDEYYYSDLIGLAVFDTGGEKIGKVTSVHDHGAGEFLEIASSKTKGSILLPFTKDGVPMVDLAAGKLIVDPPDGVL